MRAEPLSFVRRALMVEDILRGTHDASPGDRLSPVERLTLACLVTHANDDGVCWPSLPKLAIELNVTEKTLRSVITRLEERGGYIEIDRSGKEGRRLLGTDSKGQPQYGRAHRYTVLLPARDLEGGNDFPLRSVRSSARGKELPPKGEKLSPSRGKILPSKGEGISAKPTHLSDPSLRPRETTQARSSVRSKEEQPKEAGADEVSEESWKERQRAARERLVRNPECWESDEERKAFAKTIGVDLDAQSDLTREVANG